MPISLKDPRANCDLNFRSFTDSSQNSVENPEEIFFLALHNMYSQKKFFSMNKQTSTENQLIRPEDLMGEFNIKKSKYYSVLKKLGIKAPKDSKGRTYLKYEQARQIRDYLSVNEEAVNNQEYTNSALVKTDHSNLASSTKENQENIYVEPENPIEQFDLNKLMREAAELKARELAMPHLVKKAVAERMSEEDLPEDLKEKVAAVREAANPKHTPASVADSLLEQWRSSRSGK